MRLFEYFTSQYDWNRPWTCYTSSVLFRIRTGSWKSWKSLNLISPNSRPWNPWILQSSLERSWIYLWSINCCFDSILVTNNSRKRKRLCLITCAYWAIGISLICGRCLYWPRSIDDGSKHCTFQILCSELSKFLTMFPLCFFTPVTSQLHPLIFFR